MSGFLTWLGKNGRIVHNCLKTVSKAETRGHERVKRRALTDAEVAKLVQVPGGRGLIYFLACYSGLRRCEIKVLRWLDLHLDVTRPFVVVRSATTKNSKTEPLPLMPALAEALRNLREQQGDSGGKVFPLGLIA